MTVWSAAGLVVVVAGVLFLARQHDQRLKQRSLRTELDTLFRDHPRSALIRLREPFLTKVDALSRAERQSSTKATEAEARRAKWSAQIWRNSDPKIGFTIAIFVLTVIWIVMVVLQRLMDVSVMAALGSASPQVFGSVIALVFVVLGVLISGIAGVHQLLPSWLEPKSAVVRVAVIVGLIAGAIFMTGKVAHLAQYRSIDKFQQQVDVAQTNLQDVESPSQGAASSTDVTSAQLTLKKAQDQLADAKDLDRILTYAVLPAELMLAAAPIFAIELATVGGYGGIAARHRRRRDRCIDRRGALNRQFQEEASTRLAEAHPTMSAGEIDRLIASLDDNPDDNPGKPPEPGPRKRPDDGPWNVLS